MKTALRRSQGLVSRAITVSSAIRGEDEAIGSYTTLTDSTHTDAEVAEHLNREGHRSGEGKPFTARIVLHLCRAHHLASHAERLRARDPLTLSEAARRLGVHTGTIKDWHRAGLLVGHKANDKNGQLYEPPTPGDPRLV